MEKQEILFAMRKFIRPSGRVSAFTVADALGLPVKDVVEVAAENYLIESRNRCYRPYTNVGNERIRPRRKAKAKA